MFNVFEPLWWGSFCACFRALQFFSWALCTLLPRCFVFDIHLNFYLCGPNFSTGHSHVQYILRFFAISASRVLGVLCSCIGSPPASPLWIWWFPPVSFPLFLQFLPLFVLLYLKIGYFCLFCYSYVLSTCKIFFIPGLVMISINSQLLELMVLSVSGPPARQPITVSPTLGIGAGRFAYLLLLQLQAACTKLALSFSHFACILVMLVLYVLCRVPS